MRMYDIIAAKRDGQTLNNEQLAFAVNGYVSGDIPDYQMSALMMAIYLRGMTSEETAALTMLMAKSGDMLDLSPIKGIKADKHSTGGVGDKTTLIVAPIAAACGLKMAKMSGRGLGHTGGTLDKIESVPGATVTMDTQRFFKQVNDIGIAVIGQSGNITPADKKMYALRDVTATVSCIPLIASSIMSKKLALGSDCIMLDVKTGSGAFMKTEQDSIELAKAMVAIGTHNGRKTAALITDMNTPLGHNIGNSLEVIEAVETLKGNGPKDLHNICIALAAGMLVMAGMGTHDECAAMAQKTIDDGSAFLKLRDMFAAQGGDVSVIDDTKLFKKTAYSFEVKADKAGYIKTMNAEEIGFASVLLGAGRETKESEINLQAGITLCKKTGDSVNLGDTLAILYADDEALFDAAAKRFKGAVEISNEKPAVEKLVIARVDANGVTKF